MENILQKLNLSQDLQNDVLKLIEEEVPAYHRDHFIELLAESFIGGSEFSEKYKFFPVPIDIFIASKNYLGRSQFIYPEVMHYLREINNGDYVEVVLTGGIGSAKTTIAIYTTAYQLYLLGCLTRPHAEFELDPTSEIIFIFQNITERLAKTVDYNRFKSLISTTPFFQKHMPYERSIESKMVFENRIEVQPLSGALHAALGQNVIGGIIDELNSMAIVESSRLTRDQGTYDQAIALYNSISRRRKSRFMQYGVLPGILCLTSSRKYPDEFTDKKIREAVNDPSIYVYDKRVWDVAPEGRFSGNTFSVFIGDDNRHARIVDENEYIDEPDLLLDVPVEFKSDFESDIMNALREIAGVATLARFPFFMNVDLLAASFSKKNIFVNDWCDFIDRKVKIDVDRIEDWDRPRFVHIDLALTSDSAGLCIGYCDRFMAIQKEDYVEYLPHIIIDGLLEIKPPKNDEIMLSKVRDIIYALVGRGMSIRWITFDSFQSADSIQILRQKGFVTGQQSVDKTMIPYEMAKMLIYEGCVDIPYHAKTLKELKSLEKDAKMKKIDHPAGGSKDLADALASVLFGLAKRRELWALHNIPLAETPISIKKILSDNK